MRPTTLTLGALLLLLPPRPAVAGPGRDLRAAEGRPNLVLLLSDDQAHDVLGCAGNAVVRTPELDRLASEGVRFANAFVTTSLCAASRAGVLTGQYARRNRVYDFHTALDKQALARTYPALLAADGYFVGFIGKWGVDPTSARSLRKAAAGFDFWAGFSGQGDYWHLPGCAYVLREGPGGEADNTCDCSGGEGRGPGQEALHLTTRIVPAKVARFLDVRPPDRPFCLSVSFKAPHAPWKDYAPDLAQLYEGEVMPVSPAATPEQADLRPAFLDTCSGSDRARRFLADRPHLESLLRDYYRNVTGVDRAVGSIRSELERRELASSTVLVFTSDNGHSLGAHGLWGKWLAYEGSIRVPLIVLDPRLPAGLGGSVREEQVLNIDLAPTLLELAGVAVPAGVQGKSLVGLLRGPVPGFRERWLYENHYTEEGIPRVEALRTTRFKYVRYLDRNPSVEQLFDLQEDPHELRDLAGDPEHAATLAELRSAWRAACAAAE